MGNEARNRRRGARLEKRALSHGLVSLCPYPVYTGVTNSEWKEVFYYA